MPDQHSEIMRAIGNLEGKVDGINQRLDGLNGRTGKIEERVSKLEVGDAVGKTKFGFIGALGGILASLAYKIIFR